MLEGANKTSEMVTQYDVQGGPHYAETYDGVRMRVTRVVVRSTDTGYTDISVMGVSVTKDGRDKSTGDYFYARTEAIDAVRAELDEAYR